MTRLFEEREKAAELLFVRAEEARFLSYCQAVRSLAVYVMEKIGLDRYSAGPYAHELLSCLVYGLDKSALIERVAADLEANGVAVDRDDLRRELERSATQAIYAEEAPARRGNAALH
ncbi:MULTISPECIES: DUF1476 domain-containing protein [unclassified Methylobacterium]|uniref:DUF1476 domain-containing protein n=1 Tax=unclassified Methylobacterium TaxID=2615210 RepID=UPI001F274C71|nr:MULTISPECIES: DUF1476 domain-containing protein [Methylobacterium]WFT80867.1 DUF1476 domain-containing protein [Methylobacterium nodulans]